MWPPYLTTIASGVEQPSLPDFKSRRGVDQMTGAGLDPDADDIFLHLTALANAFPDDLLSKLCVLLPFSAGLRFVVFTAPY